MGYYVSISVSGVRIPKDKTEECLEVINGLVPETGFGWVDEPPEDGHPTLMRALAAWRYMARPDSSGDVEIIAFEGQKWDSDEQLFKAIAPFVAGIDGVIVCHGCDHESWRYRFINGTILEEEGVMGWR